MKNSRKELVELLALLATISTEQNEDSKESSDEKRLTRSKWLLELTDEQAGKYIKNLARNEEIADFFRNDAKKGRLKDFFLEGFSWGTSKEGGEYWSEVTKSYVSDIVEPIKTSAPRTEESNSENKDKPNFTGEKGQFYFDRLTPEQKSQFVDNYKNLRLNSEFPIEKFLSSYFESKSQFLKSSFIFIMTPQGNDYWQDIAKS